MLELMRNFFQKPKVCFMLAVICLSPIARPLLACPPPDCSAEAQALTNALNALATARANHLAAWNTYRNAMQDEEVQRQAFLAACKAYLAALFALTVAIATKNLKAIAVAYGILRATIAIEKAALAALNLAKQRVNAARAAYNAATAAVNTAINNVNAAREAYNDCLNS
jgi:hypothetical protein